MEKFEVGDKVKYRYEALTTGGLSARLYEIGVPSHGLFRVLRVDELGDRVQLSAIQCNAGPFWDSIENLESLGSVVKIGQFRYRLVELGYSEKDISRISRVITDA